MTQIRNLLHSGLVGIICVTTVTMCVLLSLLSLYQHNFIYIESIAFKKCNMSNILKRHSTYCIISYQEHFVDLLQIIDIKLEPLDEPRCEITHSCFVIVIMIRKQAKWQSKHYRVNIIILKYKYDIL
jgi:hypothetical protein